MSSPARRQIRPPPVSQHLREFAGNWRAWLALAKNLIPVVGIYLFGWSAALCVFNYWFDGLTAVATIVAAVIPRLLREMPKTEVANPTMAGNIVRGLAAWIVLVVVVALPYWIVLIPLHKLLLGAELRRALAESPALWATFGSMAVTNFYKAFGAGYDAMPENELRQRTRWDIYLLVLRAAAMFFMAAYQLAIVIVPLMALLLTYFEVWPERVLGAVFGDPKRLWEYEPDKGRKQ